MVAVSALNDRAADLLATDTTTLAEATPFLFVKLVINPFTPGPTLTIGALTFATFTGSAGKHANSATNVVGIDPATGNYIITIPDPVGGWNWVCTVAPAAPETVYGWAVLDAAGAVLWKAELLDAPVEISQVGHQVNIGTVTFTVPFSALR